MDASGVGTFPGECEVIKTKTKNKYSKKKGVGNHIKGCYNFK